MGYDSRWRLEFETLRRQCIFEPPPLKQSTLKSVDVEHYTRVLRPFHKKWGQWWLWVLLFPFLIGVIAWKRVEQFFRMCLAWKWYQKRYKYDGARKTLVQRLSSPIAFACTLSHIFIQTMVPFLGDLRRVIQRKAIWRESSRYVIFGERDTNFIIKQASFIEGKVKWLTLDKGTPQQQVMRAGYFTFILGALVYYGVMLNTMFPLEKGFFVSFFAATILFVWPLPVGIVWMLILYKMGHPFITRVFYTKAFWNRQYPGGYFGEPGSDRRVLWYLTIAGTVALWIFL